MLLAGGLAACRRRGLGGQEVAVAVAVAVTGAFDVKHAPCSAEALAEVRCLQRRAVAEIFAVLHRRR